MATPTTIYRFRVWCVDDGEYEYVWSDTAPTSCPSNAAHSIDVNSVSIIDQVSMNIVQVKEENIPTGGYFSATTMKVIAPPGVSYTAKKFPYPINGLSMTFITGSQHAGDKLNMYGVRNKVCGVLTAPITAKSQWQAQSYNVSDMVYYDGYNYVCIAATSDTPSETNSDWSQFGSTIYVSSSVTANVWNGFDITLSNGSTTDNIGEVYAIDKVNGTITTTGGSANSYSPLTPTYVLLSVRYVRDYCIDLPWQHIIGDSKIGGSYIPANTNIEVEYFNYGSDTKTMVGMVEYLY